MQESFSKRCALTPKMYDHKEPKNCPVSMLDNITEPDIAYDKCHHLLNPFKSNETSHFISNGPVNFSLQGCWVFFSFLFKF